MQHTTHPSTSNNEIAQGAILWEPLKQVLKSDLYRSKAKTEIDGITFSIKAMFGPFNFKDNSTGKPRKVISCDIDMELENPDEQNLSPEQGLLPLKILNSCIDEIADFVRQYLEVMPELKLERQFDINLRCQRPLLGSFPERRLIGVGGRYQPDELKKIREDLDKAFENQISQAGLNKPTLCIDLSAGNSEKTVHADEAQLEDVDLFDIKAALDSLDPSDITPETAARAITLHIVDYANSVDGLTPENRAEVIDEYFNWVEGETTSTIPARLATLALAPVINMLRSKATQLDHQDPKHKDSLEVLNHLSERLQNPDKPSLSVGEWLYTVYALSSVNSCINFAKEESAPCRELEERMLNLSLIKMFDKSFELPPGVVQPHFERGQTQWGILKASSNGAITILAACSELGILILENSDNFSFNSIYRHMRNKFIQQDGKSFRIKNYENKDQNKKFEQLGRGWAQPLMYLCAAAVLIKKGSERTQTIVNTDLIEELKLLRLLRLGKDTPFRGSVLTIKDILKI